MKLKIIPQKSKIKLLKVLFGLSLVCILLTTIRIYWSNNYNYLFLIWNLILAWLPLLISFGLQRFYIKYPKSYLTLFLFGLLWLLFFPNSPYIITDLIHLNGRHTVPIWYDATLLFTYALTGLLTGFISLYFIHEILDCLFHKLFNWGMVFMIFMLSGFGIYLGRVLRCNSWDLFTHPNTLLKSVLRSLINQEAIFMTITFSFVMMFSYLILHSLIHIKQQIDVND